MRSGVLALVWGPRTQGLADALVRRWSAAGVVVSPYFGDSGGKALEAAAARGLVDGVVELDLAELQADLRERVGPRRFTSAAWRGLPQWVVLGTADPRWRSLDDADSLGKDLAWKASAAKGNVQFALPTQPDTWLATLAASLHLWRTREVEVVTLPGPWTTAAEWIADSCVATGPVERLASA